MESVNSTQGGHPAAAFLITFLGALCAGIVLHEYRRTNPLTVAVSIEDGKVIAH